MVLWSWNLDSWSAKMNFIICPCQLNHHTSIFLCFAIFVSSSCIDTPCWHHRASVYAVTKASVLPTVLHSYGQRPAKCVWPCPSSGVLWPARAGTGQKPAAGNSQRRLVIFCIYIILRCIGQIEKIVSLHLSNLCLNFTTLYVWNLLSVSMDTFKLCIKMFLFFYFFYFDR